MYEKATHKKGSQTIVGRVTFFYSIVLFALVVTLMGLVFILSNNFTDSKNKDELREAAIEMTHEPEDYEAFEDGIYFSIYDKAGQVLQSSFPSGFDQTLPLKEEGVQEVTISGITYYYVDLPFQNQDQWLRAVMYSGHSDRDDGNLIVAVLLVSPVLLLVIILSGYWILRRALYPVDALTRTAKTIQDSGDLSQRLPVGKRNDEIGRLGHVLNGMLDSLEGSFEREKQVNKDLAHELRTPLAVILSETEYGQHYAEDLAEAQESLTVIDRQAKRMQVLTEEILALARLEGASPQALELIDLSQLVTTSTRDLEKLCQEKGIELELSLDDGIHVLGNQSLLERLLDNLLSNAIKFTTDRIRVSLSESSKGYHLKVWNNGPAISLEDQEKIWHRFYQIDQARTKSQETGTGLGLPLVKQIADYHHAQIDLKSDDSGTSFSILFSKH